MSDGATEIVIVRHGQTEWNRVERFRGRADVPLNETGLEQARAMARRLARWGGIAALYSSPLSRCTKTADTIAAAVGAERQSLEGIIDIDYGAWQGFTPAEVAERDPALYQTWLTAPEQCVIPGGETLEQVRTRALAALEEVALKHAGQRIVLVSHKVVCKVLVCALLGLDNSHFWRIEQDNAAINVFYRQEGAYVAKTVNDTCHIEGMG